LNFNNKKLTVNVPVVYMAQNVIILMQANSLQEPTPLQMAQVIDLPPSKSLVILST
jgi:hypothetical protein